MNISSSLTSTTASAPYSRAKPTVDVHTWAEETDGETPASVGMSENTTHGWRPISVKIHPKEFANSGSRGRMIAVQSRYRVAREPCAGTRPRRSAHRIHAPPAIATKPRPIMRRKLQYVTGMLGVKSSIDRKSTRLNSSHVKISYAVFCLKK